MSPSDQISSPIDSSLSHLQHGQACTVSLIQPSWVYKQAVLDPDYSASPLLLPRQQLLFSKPSSHHCLLLLDVPCPDEKTLFLRFLMHACQETASFCFASPLALLPTCLLRGRRSQHHKSALFQLSSQLQLSLYTSSHLCGAASCSCEPELPSVTTLPVGTGRPCGTVIAWWHKSLLNWVRSCHLVPLLGTDAFVAWLLLSGASPWSVDLALAPWCHSNKYITCIPLNHRVKVTQFSDTWLKNNY